MTDPTPVEVRAPEGAQRLEIVWDDGVTTAYPHLVLRAMCPCANCQGHQGPIQWVDAIEEYTPRALELRDIFEVGQYALGLAFGDGHSSGIYTFRYLRDLARADAMPLEERRTLAFER